VSAHELTNAVFDSAVHNYSLYVDSTEEERKITVKAILYDSLGGIYETETHIVFSKSKDKKIFGQPPHIERIRTDENFPIFIENNRVCFIGDVSILNEGGYLTEYTWEFSNATSSTTIKTKASEDETSPYGCHIFDDPGKWNIKLSVKDDSGNTTSSSTEIEVQKRDTISPQFAKVTIENDSGPLPLTVIIVSLEAQDYDGYVTQYEFYYSHPEIEDGRLKFIDLVEPPVSNDSIPYLFDVVGEYQLIIKARDDEGNTSEISYPIIVTEAEVGPQ
jgi:hypothetical protein